MNATASPTLPPPLPRPVIATPVIEQVRPAPDLQFHRGPWSLLRTFGGPVALGLAAGVAGQSETLASAPAGLLTGAGVILFTAPALVVGHQYLGMKASPGALLSALADGFARGGTIALGAAPAVLWLAATSDFGPTVGLLTLLAAGLFALLRTMNSLVDVERHAGGNILQASTVALGWAGLAAVVALRLLFAFTY